MSTTLLQSKVGSKKLVPNELGRRRHNASSSEPDQSCLRVLVVDDSPFMLKTICEILEQETEVLIVGTAFDGFHAVKRVLELEPDLVLMDVHMFGMNGLEATRLMKSCLHPPVVILVTIDDTPEHHTAAQGVGADDFLAKHNLFSHLAPSIRRLFPAVAA